MKILFIILIIIVLIVTGSFWLKSTCRGSGEGSYTTQKCEGNTCTVEEVFPAEKWQCSLVNSVADIFQK